MGMYIIGKEPDRCGVCPCFHAENPMYCQAVKAAVQKPRIVRPYANGRPDWCPLIKVPEPHGNLIGREWLVDIAHHLMNTAKNDDVANGVKWLWQYIIEAPTILQAEEGE